MCFGGINIVFTFFVSPYALKMLLFRSHPNFSKPLKILPPCVDTGLWAEDSLDIKRIVPDLQDNSIVFVAFGTYRRRTNFRLLLDSIEHLLSFVDEEVRHRIHLVIAGHCSPRSFEQVRSRQRGSM